jgi:hypothetical protein
MCAACPDVVDDGAPYKGTARLLKGDRAMGTIEECGRLHNNHGAGGAEA